MKVKLHFEKLSPGLNARLDARFRLKTQREQSGARPETKINGIVAKAPLDVPQVSLGNSQ